MAQSHPGGAAFREALIFETAAWLQAEATQRACRGFVVSRATWLQDSGLLEGAVAVPVVGGQTVWDAVGNAGGRMIVVEQPNYFGRYEEHPPDGTDVCTVQWWPSQEGPPPADVAADGPYGDLEGARHLATGLRSIPGVRLPHGSPDAPWFVVSMPVAADVVAAELQAAGPADLAPGCRRDRGGDQIHGAVEVGRGTAAAEPRHLSGGKEARHHLTIGAQHLARENSGSVLDREIHVAPSRWASRPRVT